MQSETCDGIRNLSVFQEIAGTHEIEYVRRFSGLPAVTQEAFEVSDPVLFLDGQFEKQVPKGTLVWISLLGASVRLPPFKNSPVDAFYERLKGRKLAVR